MKTKNSDGEYDAKDVYSESNKERDICQACNGSGEGMYDGAQLVVNARAVEKCNW